MDKVLISIAVMVILPVSIVLIVSLTRMNRDNKRAQIILKAIESNNAIDANLLAEPLQKPQKEALELLNIRLLRGCIFTLLGLVSSLFYWVISNTISSDIALIPLFSGCSLLAIGVSYLIVYGISRKQIQKKATE